MSSEYTMIPVTVSDIRSLTPQIKQFTFTREDGLVLPEFTGGSHIIVKMTNTLSNAYSLSSSPNKRNFYQVCVRKEDTGKGGSLFMHNHLKIGDKIEISSPKNLFPLVKSDAKHILIAGGIGITPFIPQLEELNERDANYELHYAFRAPEHGALVDELKNSAHQNNCYYYIGSHNEFLELDSLISKQPKGTHFYVCGPQSLIDAMISSCHRHHCADETIHFEQFSASQPSHAESFTVTLAKSNREVTVDADETILQAVEKIGITVECLCREGVCGTCETAILAGEAQHFDQYLDDDEKSSQRSLMICVSRAQGKSITLDL